MTWIGRLPTICFNTDAIIVLSSITDCTALIVLVLVKEDIQESLSPCLVFHRQIFHGADHVDVVTHNFGVGSRIRKIHSTRVTECIGNNSGGFLCSINTREPGNRRFYLIRLMLLRQIRVGLYGRVFSRRQINSVKSKLH